jgi:hypothetical protein
VALVASYDTFGVFPVSFVTRSINNSFNFSYLSLNLVDVYSQANDIAFLNTGLIAQDIASGSQRASGVVSLLAIARWFGHMFAIPANRPKFNVLFLFTGGSVQNFEGARAWIDGAGLYSINCLF